MEDIMKCNIIDFCEMGFFSLFLGGLCTSASDMENEGDDEKQNAGVTEQNSVK